MLAAFSKVRKIGRTQHDALKAYLDVRETLADRVANSLPTLLEVGTPFKPIAGLAAT